MRYRIYQFLVNKHSGISYRYHKLHDGAAGIRKVGSWAYLLLLNFAYYFLFFRFLGNKPEMEIYESRMLNIKMSESEAYQKEKSFLSVDAYIDRLKDYDVISFDIFDTLIFRPVSLPADVFYFIGAEAGRMDFKNIRMEAEWGAREKCNARNGHREVNLEDIWRKLEEESGMPVCEGMDAEEAMERKLCYGNPFMLEIWGRLRAMGKKMIVVSDMYLPKDCIVGILENAGYTGAKKIYLSNEYRESKADGRLYREVIRDWCSTDTEAAGRKSGNDISGRRGKACTNANGFSVVHIGDNLHSDRQMAMKCGIDVLPYQNVNKNVLLYRPMDMSCMVGSAYRAIVSGHLYNGLHSYGMEYEYGFIYGGLFVTGYCSFIHEYYKRHGLDKLLFLSRDGDILKQAYSFLYPEDSVEYVYWSRKAAAKLMADEDRHDYFRRFLFHKVNQKYTIGQILHSMELDSLIPRLEDWKDIGISDDGIIGEAFERKKHWVDLKPEEELTDKNVRLLRKFIEADWNQVLTVYSSQIIAAKKYYEYVLSDCGKVAAVDIGWAGSGALALSHLVEKVWNLPCQMRGILAGTNTLHNAEPDAAEPFLQEGKLAAYLYSQSHNRDLLKKHDPNKDYNVFWELLLSSPTPQFAGFYEGREEGEASQYLKELDITLAFGEKDANQEGIREIQRGIMDFVYEYHRHFKEFPYMFRISGRDAYAPMLAAASHNERYLRTIKKRFDLEKNVD